MLFLRTKAINASLYHFQESQPEAEAAVSPRQCRRKTTQDAHGSFFLRVGAIGEFRWLDKSVYRVGNAKMFHISQQLSD